MGILLRPLATPDIQATAALTRAAYLAPPPDHPARRWVAGQDAGAYQALLAGDWAEDLALGAEAECRVLLAVEGDRVLGQAEVRLSAWDGKVTLQGVAADPARWRQGIGRALVEGASAAASAAGYGELGLMADPQDVAFFQRCGFRPTGPCGSTDRPMVGMLRVFDPASEAASLEARQKVLAEANAAADHLRRTLDLT